jgi:excinuclease ABC subunit C
MDIKSFKKTKLPDKPGVYFFRKGGKILYIGKATSLKDRVKSYFGKDLIQNRGPLLVDMVFKADSIKWEVTDSVLEALILEAELIKKHQPKYNSKEKDDKSFNYVVITKETLPKVLIKRGKDLTSVQGRTLHRFYPYFGPYTSGTQLKEALKIIRPIFPFLDAKSDYNYEFYKQVNLVPDITTEHGLEKYKRDIKNLKLFFQGKKKNIIRNLKKEMFACAKKLQFEYSNEIKKQIFALQHINDIALIKEDPVFFQSLGSSLRSATSSKMQDLPFRIEAYDIAHMSGKSMVGVMTVVENGVPVKSEYKKFNIRTQSGSNDTGALTEVLNRRFSHPEWAFPALLVVDGGIAQLNAGKGVIEKLKVNTDIVSVVKDDRHKPKAIMGSEAVVAKHKRAILLANSEAHRFAIAFHKKKRSKNFLQ